MTTFVLVHPAWFGGWCWRKLTPLLQAAGHAVHTPTLTGLGDRAHLLDHGVDLLTHVEDVVNALVYEDLDRVVLVGNSSGGMVATGVARSRGSAHARSAGSVISQRRGRISSHGGGAVRGSSQPSPSAATSASIPARRSGASRSNTDSPSWGTNASR